MKIRALILLPFLICSSLIVAKAQSSTTLQPGVPIERTLGPGQVHEFTVNTKANSVVQLVVEQKGIDVLVKISSPGGKPLTECDTPNGAEGNEQISFLATESGKYSVSITPLNKDDNTSGQYQINLIEAREATEEEIEASKNRETAKAKGIALLLELRDAISQMRSPHTRINAQLTAADLLKDTDEKSANKYLSDAVADLKQLLAAANPENEDDTDESMMDYSSLSQLRNDVIRALAETDPDAALDFLHATTPKYSPYGGPKELVNQESVLELSIADEIGRKDPNRAVKIARQNLKKGYSPSLLNTASQLAEKNHELATELVHDIAGKLLGEDKLAANIEAANLAIALMSYYHGGNKQGQPMDGPNPMAVVAAQNLHTGLLSEPEYKQLVQKMLREVLSFTIPTNRTYEASAGAVWSMMAGLKALGDELDTVVSGSSAALTKKQADIIGNFTNPYANQYQEFQNAVANNPVEAALESIEKAPPELREQLYIALATREGNNGDVNAAKQILKEHVTNPYQRAQVLQTIEQQQIEHAMSSGKIEEALKSIGAMRTPSERAGQLVQLVAQIGPGQKRATALSLLEQARGLLPQSPQAADQEQMGALLEIARAFSPYDSKRSFEIIDPLIEQFNELCTAARMLEGFGLQSFDNDELDMQNEGTLAVITQQMSDVLGSLALINFDRAKATSDKLRLPEVRLHIHLQIAEQTITGGSSKNELLQE
ncbi:MAG TPA: hypothetical protein VJ306_21445 [Pyrinomonadaceae bacterium]|jgi:hypothetical protein|nr:hypothetical protein [Pyrinomonadaceae bacterium]